MSFYIFNFDPPTLQIRVWYELMLLFVYILLVSYTSQDGMQVNTARVVDYRVYAENALEEGVSKTTYEQLCTLIPNLKVRWYSMMFIQEMVKLIFRATTMWWYFYLEGYFLPGKWGNSFLEKQWKWQTCHMTPF